MDKWIVEANSQNERLLSFTKQKLKGSFSSKDLRWAIEHHRCKVNGLVERFCSRKLKTGDCVELNPIYRPSFTFERSRILLEKEEWLAYDKPAGISSEKLAKLSSLFLVHRLDRDTTGVILLAKTAHMQSLFEQLFRERAIQKSYLALVKGSLTSSSGVIENHIGKVAEREGEGVWAVVSPPRGAYAKTEWKCEASTSSFSLVRCHPLTGRTHQIRVHLSYLGFPIAGDLRYGSRSGQGNFHRPLLHAENLVFSDPNTHALQTIRSNLPEDFLKALKSLDFSV